MKKLFFLFCCLVFAVQMYSQSMAEKLKTAANILQKDTSLAHAILSLYVADSKTGRQIFALNGETGLAPASTQKIFTAIAAFDMLGKNFSYTTDAMYSGEIRDKILNGNLIIKGYGDPAFGSWRYADTKPEFIANEFITALRKEGIEKINGDIIIDNSAFDYQPLPGGWIWDDIGNYYGAGTWAVNWRENQYDMLLKPGKKYGDTTGLMETRPELVNTRFKNFITTAGQNADDNGYIYLSPYAADGFTQGSVPSKGSVFTISGSMPDPAEQLKYELKNMLAENGITVSGNHMQNKGNVKTFYPHYSPSLDSIIYWFLQKSINLYGEALLKTMAYRKNNFGSTANGIELLKNFWQQQGIEPAALNIGDGSGLSPQNRVTTHALVQAMLYAKMQPWFSSFYNALPVYNGIKMKSGSINSVKAYTGYYTSAAGMEYTFAIIVNNYSCSDGAVIKKLYNVLDKMK